jgi:hypothetical protein
VGRGVWVCVPIGEACGCRRRTGWGAVCVCVSGIVGRLGWACVLFVVSDVRLGDPKFIGA